MAKYYLIIRWIEEESTYSVVSNDMIIDASKRKLEKELIGETIDIVWKDESGAAEVIDVDRSKSKMDKKCRQLSEEAAEKSLLNKENKGFGKGKRTKIPKTQFELHDEAVPKKSKTSTHNILKIKESLVNAAQSKDANKCDSCETLKQEMSEISEERDHLKKKADRYKRRFNKLSEKYEELEQNSEHLQRDNMFDIGYGVLVNEKTLRYRESFLSSPSLLARRLMEMVFTSDELTSSSLRGTQANANKDYPVRPPLDQTKLTAIIEYALKKCPKQATGTDKKDVTTSISNMLRELRQGKMKGLRNEP